MATIKAKHYFFTTKTKTMRRYFKLTSYSFILFAAIILIASCNNGGDEKKGTENSVEDTSKKTPEVKQEQPKAIAIAGTLDNLWADASEFKKLPNKKLVFSFTFRTNDTLTLYGWTCKGVICTGAYDTDPAIKLTKGQAANESYGPEVYFGNVILQGSEVHDIQKKLGATYTYVVIFVSNDNPALVKTFTSVDTGIDANPSPPKNY